MNRSRTVALVATREIRQRLRSKLFVGSTLVITAVLCVLAALPALLGALDDGADVPADPVAIAVVGSLPEGAETLLEAELGAIEPRDVDDRGQARALVDDGEVEVALVDDGRGVLAAPPTGPVASGPAEAVARVLGRLAAAESADLDVGALGEALAAPPIEIEVVGGEDGAARAGRYLVAYAGVVLLYGVLMLYASLVVNGIIEEKGSRVVEVLLPAVPVRSLMAGKVLGVGAVGLGQALTLLLPPVAVVLTTQPDLLPPGSGGAVAGVVLWFVLGYALFSVLAAGLGALVSRPEEAQAVLTPATVVMVGAFFLGLVALNDPDSTLARVTAIVPGTSPFVMPVRTALASPGPGEVLLAVALSLLATVLATRLAARVYEGGILQVGARVKLGDAWRRGER